MHPRVRLPGLVEPLWERAERDPDALSIVFTSEDGERREITAGMLRDSVARAAAGLAGRGVGAGDVVLIAVGHSRELIDAILGSLALGAVPAVAPYFTGRLDPDVYARRVESMVAGARARLVMISDELAERVGGVLTESTCSTVSAQSLAACGGVFPVADVADDDLAYLQFTSGSTGTQKAVAHTQRAMREYLRVKAAVDAYRTDDVIVSWLPLYHDMGFVSGLLAPLRTGIPVVLMSPVHWVRDPKILLRAIHDYRGTVTWMPNFALTHCVRGVRERDVEGLDLTSWRQLVIGAEPIRVESVRAFAERFAPHGFDPSVFRMGYGMAENVEGICVTSLGEALPVDWISRTDLQRAGCARPVSEDAADATAVVSCGRPMAGTELRVVDEDGNQLGDRTIGEIVVRGPYCMSGGYYQRPDLTEQSFRDSWFLTGDLGYLVDRSLYVCGRRKDLIIVGGHNVHPSDVEVVAGEHPAVAAGRVVAFGVRDDRVGTERLVVACELREPADELRRREIEREIRERVVRTLDVALSELRFVDRGWIVKTSSGKLARTANRDRHLLETERPDA